MMKERIKNSAKGITLIALVITIVVLLILAGTTLSVIVSDDGIIQKAQDAKVKTIRADREEKVQLAYYAALNEDGTLNETVFEEEIQKSLKGATVTANKENDVVKSYTVTYKDFTITIKINGTFEEPTKPNENGKYWVDCEECEGRKYIPDNPIYDDSYGTLYCSKHGIQEEYTDSYKINYCSTCKKYIKRENNDICKICGTYNEFYDPAEALVVCLECLEEGKYHEIDGHLCEYCDGTGLMEVDCIKCLDEKSLYIESCEDCQSTNIIIEYDYVYGYMCPNDCFDDTYEDPGPIICDYCDATVNYYYKEVSDEYHKCADCGGDAYGDNVPCDVCVNCTSCLDRKGYYNYCCDKCKNEETIEISTGEYYYYCDNIKYYWDEYEECEFEEECGYDTTSTEAVEKICPHCDLVLEPQEVFESVCSICKSGEYRRDMKILCPDCGECWTCYDNKKVSLRVCEECGGREFAEMTLNWEHACAWYCDYSTTTLEEETVICPNCDEVCDSWENIEERCTKCKGDWTWKDMACPDCK